MMHVVLSIETTARSKENLAVGVCDGKKQSYFLSFFTNSISVYLLVAVWYNPSISFLLTCPLGVLLDMLK
jgi:hypothetical protein